MMSGSSMAEAYVTTRILHKKMNSSTSNGHGATKKSIPDNDDNRASTSTVGCFPVLFKKIHPTSFSTVPISVSSTGSS
ncbi:hypothetical protein CTI12_AA551100 [Artemisia annua]|uniref:Uncharacterized protein n=1 Tax=Artemisia annua TaxID=35608 RepID=A0A2U1KYB6_ARTAN|nr:hypothetical protein CTI12_AA551100 [Artemisia annua]